MYYCVRYILVKKRRGENWLISNYILRKKKRRGTRNLSFLLSSGLPIFSFFFLYGKLRTHSIFPSKPECYLRFHWTLGNPFPPPPSGTNKHNTTTTGGREFSCEPTHPMPTTLALPHFPWALLSYPYNTSFPFSQEKEERREKGNDL